MRIEGLADDVRLVVVEAAFTDCVKAVDVLPLKLLSPLYSAVMECEPTASDAVVKVAWAEASNVAVPRVEDPSLNVTVPVGVPLDKELTVAVKVTDCPNTDGLAEELSAVLVVAWMGPRSSAEFMLFDPESAPPATKMRPSKRSAAP